MSSNLTASAILPDFRRDQGAAKVAPTARASDMLTLQVLAVPLQAPLQPENTIPVAGLADSVTAVPLLNALVQVPPQLMPAGDDTTVPLPVRVTVNG